MRDQDPKKRPLSEGAIKQLLEGSPWTGDTASIKRTLEFEDFLSAIAFINALAPHAEELDHHPELFNVYNRVEITLTTHDADGVTALDFELAGRVDAIVGD